MHDNLKTQSDETNDDILLEINNLKKHFTVERTLFGKPKKVVKAVDDISFQIKRGETFGLVGESGCGKSTAGRSITRLYDITSGDIKYDGQSIANLNDNELKTFRKRMQIIFQDPYSSLNPGMTVLQIINEPLEIHGNENKTENREKVINLLERVGMKEEHIDRFPHEFSGGQRQRISIARALAANPEFILCDEPLSALDVSVQAQVVNMLEDLQAEFGLTYLFIAHDLSMVRHISDRIGVMYLGKLVEIAPSDELYENPAHPYTKALLSSIPIPDPRAVVEEHDLLSGDIPSSFENITGCNFRSRCPFAMDKCAKIEPKLTEINPGHFVACHLFDE